MHGKRQMVEKCWREGTERRKCLYYCKVTVHQLKSNASHDVKLLATKLNGSYEQQKSFVFGLQMSYIDPLVEHFVCLNSQSE